MGGAVTAGQAAQKSPANSSTVSHCVTAGQAAQKVLEPMLSS